MDTFRNLFERMQEANRADPWVMIRELARKGYIHKDLVRDEKTIDKAVHDLVGSDIDLLRLNQAIETDDKEKIADYLEKVSDVWGYLLVREQVDEPFEVDYAESGIEYGDLPTDSSSFSTLEQAKIYAVNRLEKGENGDWASISDRNTGEELSLLVRGALGVKDIRSAATGKEVLDVMDFYDEGVTVSEAKLVEEESPEDILIHTIEDEIKELLVALKGDYWFHEDIKYSGSDVLDWMKENTPEFYKKALVQPEMAMESDVLGQALTALGYMREWHDVPEEDLQTPEDIEAKRRASGYYD